MMQAAMDMGANIPRVANERDLRRQLDQYDPALLGPALLAIANMKAKDIMGYLVSVLLVSGIIIGAVLVFWPV
jgi:short subunit fatty acids transporter